jgi:hypothetical protein
MPISSFQLDQKHFWYIAQTRSIGHPLARGRGPLHSRAACAFFHSCSPLPLSLYAQRNYHAGKRKMPAASSSRPSTSHTTQQHGAVIQSTPSSPPAANTSSVFAVAGTPGTMGPPSRPHNTVAVWRARFVRLLCCAPI